ncbi:PIG-L family deacetylase [bacterium]|nr:PIG-L family deacetylase [bacterium]
MIGVRQLMDYFTGRRLRLRVRQIAALAGNSNVTVYPVPLVFDGPPQRVLVLTPHADDETFGMGGSLQLHRERGDDIHVLLFSDNAASIDAPGMATAEKISLRAEEFAAAMQAQGISSHQHLQLGNRDFEKDVYPEALFQCVIEKEPEVLYLPSLFDNHHDHRVLNIWLLRALRTPSGVRPLIRGFEVWSPLPATAVTDITQHIEIKRKAMRCYASQQEAIDYAHHIEGLNAYRAMTFGEKKTRYAEAFLELPADAYLDLVETTLLQ